MFDDINNLFTKENLPPVYMEVQKEIFMINRFLSMLRRTFTSAQKSNLLSTKLPNRAAYLHLFHMVPAEKNPPRIPYIKKAKGVPDLGSAAEKRAKRETAEKISKHMNCSMQHAYEIVEVLIKNGHDPFLLFGIKKGK